MITLIQFVLVLVLFLAVNYAAWYITEKDKVPIYLDYKPFQCRLCLTTWALAAIYIALGVSFHLWILLIVGLIITVLNAIALIINQKEKTISLSDFD